MNTYKAPPSIVILLIISIIVSCFTIPIALGSLASSFIAPQILIFSALVTIIISGLCTCIPIAGLSVLKKFSLGVCLLMIMYSWVICLFWYGPFPDETMRATILSGTIETNYNDQDTQTRYKNNYLSLTIRLENGSIHHITEYRDALSPREQETYFHHILQTSPEILVTFKRPINGIQLYKKHTISTAL